MGFEVSSMNLEGPLEVLVTKQEESSLSFVKGNVVVNTKNEGGGGVGSTVAKDS